MRLFKYIVPAFLILSACVKPHTGKDDSSGATFNVEFEGGKAVPSVSGTAVWKGVPEAVRVTMQVCIRSVATNTPLRGQEFSIINPENKKSESAVTNTKGCLNWTEKVDYNHFAAESGWITLERDVIGDGVNSGSRRIRIGVNPWAVGEHARDSGEAVVSLDAGQSSMIPRKVFAAKNAAKAQAGEVGKPTAQLLVQNVSIKAIPEDEGSQWVTLRVVVTMEPVIQMTNSNGETKYQDVPDGKFDLKMQLLASNVGSGMNRKVILFSKDNKGTGRTEAGKLKAEITVRQERRVNQGNLELALEVSPSALHGADLIKPFSGLFRFGSGLVAQDQSGAIATMCLDNPESCEFNKLLAGADNYKDLSEKGYVRGNERYVFSNLKLRFTSILPGETTTQRTVFYTASTCITDNQTGRPLADTPMVVRYIKSQEKGKMEKDFMEPDVEKRQTDESGCLIWNGKVFHKYYKPEQFLEKEVAISKEGEEAKFERKLKFYLNPWDDKFTFGFDAREFTDEFLKTMGGRGKIESRFFLGDYNYRTVRFLYSIDQFMDLEVKKGVLMGLVPKVLRYSGIINARKMVEPLRDGIYLMKVAIQKSYLDPRDNAGLLLANEDFQAKLERIGDRKLATKDFITTNMALVRVVDGVIVYPIELTMRDLRLMRVRSNMIIQLETVDERMVQAYHVLRKEFSNTHDLEQKLKEYKNLVPTLEQLKKEYGDVDLPEQDQLLKRQREIIGNSPDIAAAQKTLQERVEQTQNRVRDALRNMKERIEAGGPIGHEIDEKGKSTSKTIKLQTGQIINTNFELRKELKRELEEVLNINDFSTVALPKKEDVDLNIFVEEDSGLEKRSFVGPVIFLSNAYGDSMRATDNLDEANCFMDDADPKKKGKAKDALARSREVLDLDAEATKATTVVEDALHMKRQNNAYQFNKYFGSLNNLCYIQVDDLIEQEKENNRYRIELAEATALKYNYVETYNMDFVSLTGEPLRKIKPECVKDMTDPDVDRVAKCLENTTEHTLNMSVLGPWINDGLEYGHRHQRNWGKALNPFSSERTQMEKSEWKTTDYSKLFFEHSLDGRYALCNLLANKMTEEFSRKSLVDLESGLVRDEILRVCGETNGLVHDVLMRVDRTGTYTFLGGLNLNLNVGEGFSVGTSSGWSAGADITDMVSGPGSMVGGSLVKGAATMMKPVTLKYGTSMSSSEGTSVSESTYLVSQIAGFDVEIQQYELCSAIRLSPQAINALLEVWDGWAARNLTVRMGKNSLPKIGSSLIAKDAELLKSFRRGLFVCEGATRTRNKPQLVKESYFYFTQHFTEGDMLDQADLYNHPWLLSMRGMRDFSVFVEKVRAQESSSLPDFLYHVTGNRPPRVKGWALEHLTNAYQNVMPTFPGYYRVPAPGEADLKFVLEQAGRKLSVVDSDPLGEVKHPKLIGTQPSK